MNKNESKYFNTAVKMDKALISLLEKKDFEYITIREICSVAGVNRSTFYLHYQNTNDLLSETTEYIINDFASRFDVDRSGIGEGYKTHELSQLVFITPEYIRPYLTYIKENRRVFKMSLKHLGTMNFDSVYNKMFKFVFNPVLERFNFPSEEREYVIRFYLTGITALVNQWLENDCREPIETIERIITDCVLGNNSEIKPKC